MEPKQILSANLLDIIFDDRNKAYGAYELRVTYPERIKKSLLVTFTIGLLAFGGAVLANSLKPKEKETIKITPGVILSDLPPEEKKPEPLPEPEKKPEPVQVKTQQYTEFNIVKDEPLDPPPTQDDFDGARIALDTKDGVDDVGIIDAKGLDPTGTGIIEQKEDKEPDMPFTRVEVDAKFIGNWEKFLYKNLNANVPVDNGAPAGTYKVIVQFIVDVDGNVSDIKALTNHGYGMEQEAIRVLKKATKWEPAFQNSTHVKAYRSQPITFQIESE
jgi:protein TonB